LPAVWAAESHWFRASGLFLLTVCLWHHVQENLLGCPFIQVQAVDRKLIVLDQVIYCRWQLVGE